MSSKKNKKAIVPKRRFPEFKGAWEVPTLGDISERIVEKVGERSLQTVSISAGIGFVSQAEKFSRDISGEQYKNYTVLKKGEFSYNKGNSKKFPQGCVYKLKEFDEVAAPNVFVSFRFKEGYLGDFYQGYFENNFHGEQLKKHITSGARSNGLLNISPDSFFGILLPTPRSTEEQQKIANCLSSLDEVIALQSKKVESLKDYKQGLMQLLFPRQGQAAPELRFSGFKGNWTSAPFEKVFTRITTKNAENNQNSLTISAQAGLISQLDFFNKKISAKDLSGYYLLHKGDFAYNKSYSQGYPMGAIKRLNLYEKGVVSTLYICFRIKPGYSGSFFEYYFDFGMMNNEISQIAQEGARNHGLLNIGVHEFFGRTTVKFPEIEQEQQKISDCLLSVDQMIFAQSQKLDALKEQKKGLMQQLFPVLEDEEKK